MLCGGRWRLPLPVEVSYVELWYARVIGLGVADECLPISAPESAQASREGCRQSGTAFRRLVSALPGPGWQVEQELWCVARQ